MIALLSYLHPGLWLVVEQSFRFSVFPASHLLHPYIKGSDLRAELLESDLQLYFRAVNLV